MKSSTVSTRKPSTLKLKQSFSNESAGGLIKVVSFQEPKESFMTGAQTSPTPLQQRPNFPQKTISQELSLNQQSRNLATAKNLATSKSGLLGVDPMRLAKALLPYTIDQSGVDVIQKTLEMVRPSQRDNVSSHFVDQLPQERLNSLTKRPEGHQLLCQMVDSMNHGFVSDFEGRQIIKAAPLLYPKHGPLITDELLPQVRRSLESSGSVLQSLHDGAGRINFDEYSVVVEKMPPGYSPELALQTFGREPNETLDNTVFNAICHLDLQSEGNAEVGDIYEIDLFGPNNGDVMVKNTGAEFLEYTTIRTPKNGTHPENGTRRFGFENNDDGSVTFYSRSVSRTTEILGDNGFIIRTGAKLPQIWCGEAILHGISDKIESLGGKVRPDSSKTVIGPQ